MRNLSDLKNFDSIRIHLASSEEMLSWSFGEVTKPETINYRTFKAERDGLFDEKIFGPVKNFECYCGKYKGIRYKGVICDKCGVEVTRSRVRRERMGHISLATPVVHVWFFKGIPSKLALLLDISPRKIESVIYFSSFIVTDIDGSKKAAAIDMIEKDLQVVKDSLEEEFKKEEATLQKDLGKVAKGKDELKTQEASLKLKQQIQALRKECDERIEEQDKMFKLILKKVEGIDLFSIISDNEYMTLSQYVDIFAKLEIGAEAVEGILSKMDLNKLSSELREQLESSKGQKAQKISKRLRVVEQFRRSDINPAWIVMDVIAVIPPDLRPLVQLEGGRFASSDLNELYRRVINRNNRLRRLLDIGAPEIIVRNEKRMLQEAVDALFDSSKQRRKQQRQTRREPRSIADMIKGKQGTFRLNLLGKRVDYSGRGVIINGPKLSLNECGVPKEMALELFKPFVLRELLSRGHAPNIKSAKFVLDARGPEVWDILEEVVQNHPVLLNRAPTLWRLGIQAFYPRLIEGNAIRLHLCVCSGFNADFDGDQMAVHVPLSEEAREEARNVMISINNLLSPSNGSPMSVPTKIMLFGIYYLTSVDNKLSTYDRVFFGKEELLYFRDTHSQELSHRRLVKVKIDEEIVETTVGRILFNEILPESLGFLNDTFDKKKVNALLAKAFSSQPNEVLVKLIDDIKDLGLQYGTLSGYSVALSDMHIPEDREKIIESGKEAVKEIDKNLWRGLITKSEAQRLTEDTWNRVTAEIDESVWAKLPEDNPVKVLVNSGSTRASRDQVKQIAGSKGLISDPTGRIVPMPILGNYKRGLSGLEYFVGARGARKGLVDKGLKTADAGYLTRRLVDVSQDMLVREDDCGAQNGRKVIVGKGTLLQSFADRIVGRYLAEGVKVKSKGKSKTLLKRGTLLTREDIAEVEEAGVKELVIRSPLNCETSRGICTKCYGLDLVTQQPVAIGAAVGVIAAQSIGEPGTQLTMRTFHTGGIAGKDITQGLPRVEEIVEARAPKYLSVMSEITGTVKISESGDDRKITVIAADKSEGPIVMEYQIDPVAEIVVEDEQLVAEGEKLTAGHLDLTELLRTTGVENTKKYIIDEIQRVYASQGVSLNDKHIEIVVSRMFGNVCIEDAGDTDFLAGELVTEDTFNEVNEEVLAQGGAPATARVTLLGITKSSLNTDSFLSAASFIQTSSVLTDAASSGRVDKLLGLKENVIIGRLIPTGERAAVE